MKLPSRRSLVPAALVAASAYWSIATAFWTFFFYPRVDDDGVTWSGLGIDPIAATQAAELRGEFLWGWALAAVVIGGHLVLARWFARSRVAPTIVFVLGVFYAFVAVVCVVGWTSVHPALLVYAVLLTIVSVPMLAFT